jgi:MerR family transcriptional regulator, thiopeptide resistance regulator
MSTPQHSSDHEAEARERWGATEAFAQSQERMAGYSPADMSSAKKAQEDALQGVIHSMQAGFPPTSLEAMVAAEKCRLAICDWYFECSPQMHRQLAELYVTDERFRSFYESQQLGLATYFHDAIVAAATKSQGQ